MSIVHRLDPKLVFLGPLSDPKIGETTRGVGAREPIYLR